MRDVAPGAGYPPGANAVVVEGLGYLNGCYAGTAPAALRNSLNAGLQTIIEITPQSHCAAIGSYEQYVTGLIGIVLNQTTNFGKFGGIMFDEEAGYGFGAGTLHALNAYTERSIIAHFKTDAAETLGEDGATTWTVSQYKTIMAAVIPAPQVYGTAQVAYVNARYNSGLTQGSA